MERPWKRIIPQTEDSDSWSSVDNELDMNQQWISINKRARLNAQANMRGENLPRDPSDSENVQNALDNVLLHHDYAEQTQSRHNSSFRIPHSSTLSPMRIFDNGNEVENRTPVQYRNIFAGNASTPVQQRSEYDLFHLNTLASTVQPINSSAPNSSTNYDNNARARSLYSSLPPYSFANVDQVDTNTPRGTLIIADGTLPPSATTFDNHSPRQKRHVDLHKKFNFLIAMRRYKYRPEQLSDSNQVINENENEAGSSSMSIPPRFEATSVLPSCETSQNPTSIDNTVEMVGPSSPLNNTICATMESGHRSETAANESNLEIIQVPPVERLESAEGAENLSTITVATSDEINGPTTPRNFPIINKDSLNSMENAQTREPSIENQVNLPTAENANQVNLDNPSPEISQNQVANRETDVHYLNQGLLNILECPVCWEFISPPIHQCKRGHLLCLSCMQRLHSCPTCRSRFTNLRNLSMEKVAAKLRYPCKNSQSGCNETMRLVDKPEHEANCMHRVYRCIVSICPWNGKHPDLLNHMTSAHHEIVVYGDHKFLYISLDNSTASENWILLAHDVIFRVNFAINTTLGKIHGCVQYVGPRKMASNYSYTFKAENTIGDMQRRVEYTRTTHNDQDKLSAIYNAGDAFMLMRNTASFFSACTDNHMLVKVSIKKTNEMNE